MFFSRYIAPPPPPLSPRRDQHPIRSRPPFLSYVSLPFSLAPTLVPPLPICTTCTHTSTRTHALARKLLNNGDLSCGLLCRGSVQSLSGGDLAVKRRSKSDGDDAAPKADGGKGWWASWGSGGDGDGGGENLSSTAIGASGTTSGTGTGAGPGADKEESDKWMAFRPRSENLRLYQNGGTDGGVDDAAAGVGGQGFSRGGVPRRRHSGSGVHIAAPVEARVGGGGSGGGGSTGGSAKRVRHQRSGSFNNILTQQNWFGCVPLSPLATLTCATSSLASPICATCMTCAICCW